MDLVIHRNDMVERLADGDERSGVERNIPRPVDEQRFARSTGQRAVLARALAIQHHHDSPLPLFGKIGVLSFRGKLDFRAVATGHVAGVNADRRMEVRVEATVTIPAVAVLHRITRDVDFARVNAGDARLAVIGHHVVHAVEAHSAIGTIVFLEDDFLRAASENRPVAGHGGKSVAGDVAGGTVEHEDLQRGVDVAVGDLDVRAADIDRAGTALVAPTLE